MAGIYIHIPFCRQACHYCNFHFSTSLKNKELMVHALLKEMELQQGYLEGETIETIYFGGGTPSLLSSDELALIFRKIAELYHVNPQAEITLEANPDDLSAEKLLMLKDTPVNRLSIGIQSFFDEDLKWMNRAHSAKEARLCIENALKSGFNLLTLDLIYGVLGLSADRWEKNLQLAVDYQVPHLSCYCLTVEPQTALDHFVKKGKAAPVDEEQAASQFVQMTDFLSDEGYEHYEISNFATPGAYSKHNTAYWSGEKYLGIGPSAHSFNGASRRWNISNNALYLRSIREDRVPFEEEVLTTGQKYNEYVMTALRTKWGIDVVRIAASFPEHQSHFLAIAEKKVKEGLIYIDDGKFVLSKAGKLMADRIAMELFA